VSVQLNLYRCNVTGGLQLAIEDIDDNGTGHGYRIFGPKFLGDSTLLRRYVIDDRDVDEIRSYLDRRGEATPAEATS
jgi:hypothetical protein